MPNSFNRCLGVVLEFEGGFDQDPDDHGGDTCRGITQGEYDIYRHKHGAGARSVELISDDELRDIYENSYWIPSKAGVMPDPLALVQFDGAVNAGVKQQNLWLQRALSVTDDGILGPRSLAALAQAISDPHGAKEICVSILQQRTAFYRGLVAKDHTQGKYIDGWLNRVHSLQQVSGFFVEPKEAHV